MITKDQITTDHKHERMASGLRPLKRDDRLDLSAQKVARRLATADQGIAHAPRWYRVINKATRMRYRAIGENLADGFTVISKLMGAWLRSPAHRKNIMSRKFTRMGVGVSVARSGQVYYVVHFGG